MAKAPQIATHAPSGARNPQKPTVADRSASLPAKVVFRASQPHATPASTPPR